MNLQFYNILFNGACKYGNRSEAIVYNKIRLVFQIIFNNLSIIFLTDTSWVVSLFPKSCAAQKKIEFS
jgi:hypothetical protein